MSRQTDVCAPRCDVSPDGDGGLWLPPRRLRRYQIFKTLGGLLFAAVFAGWALAVWPRVTLAGVAAVMVLITVWVTLTSFLRDQRRAAGRQLQVTADAMQLTTPVSVTRIPWADVHSARWQEHETASQGLWLFGDTGQPLAHIDRSFLADAGEARAFLGWARQRAPVHFPVAWQ